MTKRITCFDTTFDEQGKAVVVTGIEFENPKYAGDPVELARADKLVFRDISASHKGRDTKLSMVEKIAEHVSIPLFVIKSMMLSGIQEQEEY